MFSETQLNLVHYFSYWHYSHRLSTISFSK